MRVMGHNVLAVVVAAIVIYAIEFLIFAVLIPGEDYMRMTGMQGMDEAASMARMPYGILMPIFTAIGLSMVIKWRGAVGWVEGLKTALLMAVLLGFGTSLYGYVYGTHTEQFLLVNLAHFLVCWGAAGAVLGAWK